MEELYKTIDLIVSHQKKARQSNDFYTLMKNGEALLEYMPNLIRYSVEQEAEYRKFEAKTVNEVDSAGKMRTSSFAETQAKATDFYKNWQQARLFIELIYEMVQMSKKLAGNIDKELQATR